MWCDDDLEREFRDIDILRPEYLSRITKTEDLESVECLKLTVDTTTQSIFHLGDMVPNLRELDLSDSILLCFRDFGSSLSMLTILKLPRSGVTDLDGISVLENLTELYLSSNEVASISPIAMHENIQILDLNDNLIHHIAEVDSLGTCPALKSLALSKNPIALVDCYRRLVHHLAPQIMYLDTEAIIDTDSVSDEEMNVAELQLMDIPLTHSLNRQFLLKKNLLRAATVNIGENETLSTSSELTHGQDLVFAGNLASSMRRRKRMEKLPTQQQEDLEQDFSDRSIQNKLDELLILSCGLEKEFKLLSSNLDSKTRSELRPTYESGDHPSAPSLPRSPLNLRRPRKKPTKMVFDQLSEFLQDLRLDDKESKDEDSLFEARVVT